MLVETAFDPENSVMSASTQIAEPMPHILVVDDDREIRTLLQESLVSRGFRVSAAANAREMDLALLRDRIDLIILDVMMPGEDGVSACRRVRNQGGPPVIFLSALGDETDTVLGLEIGASHYLRKPCGPREVIATVRAALRLREGNAVPGNQIFAFAGWTMDVSAWEVTDPDGILIGLTDGEFAILRAFVEHPRRVLTREQLLEWSRGPDSDAFDRAIDVQVSRLRRKLRAAGEEMFRTVRNEGYMFTPAVTRR